MGKPPQESKTVWVGIIEIVIASLVLFTGTQIIADYPDVVAWIGFGVGVLTIILRKLTKQPLTISKD